MEMVRTATGFGSWLRPKVLSSSVWAPVVSSFQKMGLGWVVFLGSLSPPNLRDRSPNGNEQLEKEHGTRTGTRD